MTTKNKSKTKRQAFCGNFKNRYLLVFILIVAYVASVTFTTQRLSLFNPGGVTYMNDLEFYLMVVASTLLGVGLLVFAVRYFKIKLNRPLLIVCLVLMVIDVVAVLTFPNAINGESFGHTWTYRITDSERIRYIFGWFVADLALYCFIGVFPSLFRSHKTVDFILWAGVGIGFLLIVCSFIIERDGWIGLIKGTNPGWRAQSITNYQNTFGFAVLWSFCCGLILYGKYRRVAALICTIFMALMTLLLQVKTCCAAVGIATILALIWFPISGWKKRRKQQIALISVALAIIAFITIIAVFEIPGLKGIGATIRNTVVSLFSLSGGTMTGRTLIWHDTLGNMVRNPTILLFGTGDGVFEWFVTASAGIAEPSVCEGYPVHNGFLFVLGRFGIVGILIYLFGLGYIFYDIVHAIKVRKEGWMGVIAIAFVCYLIHSIGEDDALLDMRLKGIMGLVISWLPLATSRREWKERTEGSSLREAKQTFKKVDSSLYDVLKVSYAVTSLLMVLTVGLSPLFEISLDHPLLNGVYSSTGIALLLLTLPLLITEAVALHRKGNLTRSYIHLALISILTIGGLAAGFLIDSQFYLIAMALASVLILLEGTWGLELKKVRFLDVLPILIRLLSAFVVIGLSHSLTKFLDPQLLTRTTIVIVLAIYGGFMVIGLSINDSINGWNGLFDVFGSKAEAIYEKIALRRQDKSENRINSLY